MTYFFVLKERRRAGLITDRKLYTACLRQILTILKNSCHVCLPCPLA